MSMGQTFRPAIAVQATPDYADGDSVGPLVTMTNFARAGGGSGIVTRFALRSLISIGVQNFVHIFDSNPTASTFTDNAALVIHANDRDKILKTIAIAAADWVTPKGASPWYTVELVGVGAAIPYLYYDLSAGRNLYFAIEADGVINFASTADLAAIVTAENG
jgi:hypothetical protein